MKKYMILIFILNYFSLSINSGFYLDEFIYERGIRCEKTIEKNQFCKKEKYPKTSYNEGKRKKILIYKNQLSNNLNFIFYNEEKKKFDFLTLNKMGNFYKSEFISNYLVSDNSENGIFSKQFNSEIIVEKLSENTIKIYDIDSFTYIENVYKLNKELSKEEETSIQNFLKLMNELKQ